MINQNIGKENQNLEIALIDEVTGEKLKELLTEGFDLTLDQFLEDGILKEIPFFGSLYKLFKASFGIRESIFAKKVYKFLTELKEIPQEKREAFISKLESSHIYRQKVGEKLLILIEKLDDIEKPQIVGRLLSAAIYEKISYEEFLRLSSIVDKAFLPDLLKLKDNRRRIGISQITKEHFATIGIMSIELKENTRDQTIIRMATLGDQNKNVLPSLKYDLNNLGRKLVEYGLNTPNKESR